MNPQEYESPFTYCPELKEEYLIELSQNMLKVVEDTINSLNTPLDDNYTLETCIFGRMRQLFILLDKDSSKPWVKIASPTMDYVPRICNIPVRVFKDDPIKPRKKKIFYRNDCEQHQLSLLFDDEETVVASQLSWRLFIQAPATIDDKGAELEDLEDDYRVVLVGYDIVTNAIRAMWQSQTTARDTLHLVSDDLPEAKSITRQPIVPKSTEKEMASSDE
jgi:hypothetical protein